MTHPTGRETAGNLDVMRADVVQPDAPQLDALFHEHYGRITRVIARLVRDRGRAEELAVEVFLKWTRHAEAHGIGAAGWLYRTAVRAGLDELRRQSRRARMERLVALFLRSPRTPEELHDGAAERQRVRVVLSVMRRRQAALLVLRSDGLTYEEIAMSLRINATSVGTFISRAQRAFREEYARRYGTYRSER